jgi:hypothetical protein
MLDLLENTSNKISIDCMSTTSSPFSPLICNDNISEQNIVDITAKYNYVLKLTTTNNQDTDTLNRKSFYESQEYSNLLIWNFWIVALYYVLAIVLVIILFISENQFQLTNYQKGAATILLLAYPYVISYIIAPIMWAYEFIISFIPYNVYNNI